jgi:tRNA (mo5U34)-methyltransferase
MNLETLQNKKNECRTWKNVEPWYNQLQEASKIEKSNLDIDYGDWFSVGSKEDLSKKSMKLLLKLQKNLIPWRKGPFKIFDLRNR